MSQNKNCKNAKFNVYFDFELCSWRQLSQRRGARSGLFACVIQHCRHCQHCSQPRCSQRRSRPALTSSAARRGWPENPAQHEGDGNSEDPAPVQRAMRPVDLPKICNVLQKVNKFQQKLSKFCFSPPRTRLKENSEKTKSAWPINEQPKTRKVVASRYLGSFHSQLFPVSFRTTKLGG